MKDKIEITQKKEAGVSQVCLQAYNDLSKPGPSGISEKERRQAAIFEYILDNPGKTAMEIAMGMGFEDPNKVRPRITELAYHQPLPYVIYGEKRRCEVTDRLAHTVYPENRFREGSDE